MKTQFEMSFCAHYEQYGADALAWPWQGKNLKSFFFLSTLFSFFSAPKPPDPRNLAGSDTFFLAGALCLSAGHHLRLTRGPAGNRTTTGSLSVLDDAPPTEP